MPAFLIVEQADPPFRFGWITMNRQDFYNSTDLLSTVQESAAAQSDTAHDRPVILGD
jgi:hypothetical protein